LCVLDDDLEGVHSALRTTSITALCLHIPTIAKLVQNDISFYHVTVALQLLVSTITPFGRCLRAPGWGQIGIWTRVACCINCLVIVGEVVFLQKMGSTTAALEEACLTERGGQFTLSSLTFFYTCQTTVNLLFIVTVVLILFPLNATIKKREFARDYGHEPGEEEGSCK